MRKFITATSFATLIAFTGTVQAQETTKMSLEEVQQATVSTQGTVPAGSIGPEATLWILLGIVFITALATAGGSNAAPAIPASPAPS